MCTKVSKYLPHLKTTETECFKDGEPIDCNDPLCQNCGNTHLIEGCDLNGNSQYSIINDSGNLVSGPHNLSKAGLNDCCTEETLLNTCTILNDATPGNSFGTEQPCNITCDVGDTVTIYNSDGSIADSCIVTAASVGQKYQTNCAVLAGQSIGC